MSASGWTVVYEAQAGSPPRGIRPSIGLTPAFREKGQSMPPSIHDGLFKSTFSQVEHAAGVLRTVLRALLVARLDFTTLAVRQSSFIDEELSERRSDLLFSLNLAGRLVLWCLRSARTPDQLLTDIARWADITRDVRRAPTGVAALLVIWR